MTCVNAASLLLHVDSDDAGALLGEGVQVGPVGEVAPGGQREVDVVAEGDLELVPMLIVDNSIIVSSADLLPAPGEDVAPGVGEGGGGVVVALDVDSVARRTRLQLVWNGEH